MSDELIAEIKSLRKINEKLEKLLAFRRVHPTCEICCWYDKKDNLCDKPNMTTYQQPDFYCKDYGEE